MKLLVPAEAIEPLRSWRASFLHIWAESRVLAREHVLGVAIDVVKNEDAVFLEFL